MKEEARRKRIRKLRNDLGLSQEQMAREMGMSRTNYCRIESGPRKPTNLHLALAKAIYDRLTAKQPTAKQRG